MLAQQLRRSISLKDLRGSVLGDERAVTLVVGEIGRWASEGRTMPDVQDLTYIDFSELDQSTLDALQPDVVLSPLVTDAFDAFQIVRYLDSFGYKGRYRAVAPQLPNVAMVKNEINSAAPSIDFDIVVMPPKLVSVS
jgi:hypothetical protein